MTFEFLDVGMGDGTFVMMGNSKATAELALIDFGVQPFTKFKVGVDDALIYLVNTIADISKARGKTVPYLDHLFITHPDQDHYNRIMTLIQSAYTGFAGKALSIGRLTYGGTKGSYPGSLINNISAYVVDQNINDLANLQHSKVEADGTVTPYRTFVNDGVALYLLNCNYPTAATKVPNPLSLCLMFQDTSGNKMIFMGDAEDDVEAKIITHFKDATPGFLNAYGLKLGHHGSAIGTSQAWINAVQPKAIFASGDFVWSHPYCSTIKRVIDSNTLGDIFSHRFCCGGSGPEYKEYFNNAGTKAVCLNLWYVTKDGPVSMKSEEDGSVSVAPEGTTFGVQWELNFSGKSTPVYGKTTTWNPV
jgi:hypothetical protein